MKHAEVVIARQAVDEGRGLVVIVNKMDLLTGQENKRKYESVINAVPEEIQTVIPQVCLYTKLLSYETRQFSICHCLLIYM